MFREPPPHPTPGFPLLARQPLESLRAPAWLRSVSFQMQGSLPLPSLPSLTELRCFLQRGGTWDGRCGRPACYSRKGRASPCQDSVFGMIARPERLPGLPGCGNLGAQLRTPANSVPLGQSWAGATDDLAGVCKDCWLPRVSATAQPWMSGCLLASLKDWLVGQTPLHHVC